MGFGYFCLLSKNYFRQSSLDPSDFSQDQISLDNAYVQKMNHWFQASSERFTETYEANLLQTISIEHQLCARHYNKVLKTQRGNDKDSAHKALTITRSRS